MSAGCNGGPSAPIPGAPQALTIGPAAISAIIGLLASFLDPATVFLDGLALEIGTLCGQDPPPMPVWDANDALILILGSSSPFFNDTIIKMDNLVRNWAWDKYCECTGGITGPVLTAPAPPPGVSAPNPTSSQPCFIGHWSADVPVDTASDLSMDFDITQTILPNDGRVLTGHGVSSSGKIYGIPSGTTRVDWTGNNPAQSPQGGNSNYSYACWLFDTNGTALTGDPILINPPTGNAPGAFTGTFNIPPTASYWVFTVRHVTPEATPLALPVMGTQVWCGGAAPGAQETCCPPDPGLTLGIQTIINLLTNQATKPPPTYTKGNVHAGLTGTASISVTGLFGVQIELTAGVPTQIQFPGVPPYERSVGWCSILTADGMIDETRITRQHQVWASALAPYATTLGFQLNDGFSMTLTELLPG